MTTGIFRRPVISLSLGTAVAALISGGSVPDLYLQPATSNDVARSRRGIRRYTSAQLRINQRKGITAAEQKRRSRKRRNVLRHKAHLRRRRN